MQTGFSHSQLVGRHECNVLGSPAAPDPKKRSVVTSSIVLGFVVLLAQVLLLLPYQHQPIEIIQRQYDHNHMVWSVEENMS